MIFRIGAVKGEAKGSSPAITSFRESGRGGHVNCERRRRNSGRWIYMIDGPF